MLVVPVHAFPSIGIIVGIVVVVPGRPVIRIRPVPLYELLYSVLKLIIRELLLLEGRAVLDSLYLNLVVVVCPVQPLSVLDRTCYVRVCLLL